ncbi:hypothetical protein A2631_05080 [Candidatus Daviesbacteria bacterium RIFCSPHIGHO2_01_FULL_44_29]|uniref:Uncharacterized protein n=1 Tax=Candidatus Daviesbacteria bacterium RIFCSPHIGHO2_02_FULL_43_12 TaxID=1797776 RepID=A0A1F5KH17_9BACT|nr:MAG: hypothetical protein A2631_05080 [Candidatus Daviesbacteria bacterium RIFCSPHIGHO2_01_FULL_44_29]OGE40095.1 MAG: hypothetical protein A3D25_04810 [Candidatus Daviesbacteria bacterium RIFCSPHIGHO2_02_FULL_43_12]OGE41043.1 MAG: hypothetical protein A3E86_04905 [Candidatus Daviesbacteria bacterium RIFCSPHIGHO2_12_FULL_47_45]OGE70225.1 MAG: hypothetical protein A3B55_00760 [Candidatus Daviesbacteria bacterium RIFCSPLOWO2_01_FULL_43_15]
MQYLKVNKIQKEFHIEGFPDGVKVIRVKGRKAQRFSDLVLHKRDLDFADECLNCINQATNAQELINEALWRSAIIFYIKCFGNNASRSQLSERVIYKNDPKAVKVFNYFSNLRNKYIVHDENSYSQSLPGAILNKGDKSYKIEKIICFSALLETLTKKNINKLHLLIKTAQLYVASQNDKICEILTIELEASPYNKLLSREPVVYNAPTLKEIDKKRVLNN